MRSPGWDLRYTTPRRQISAFEQHCHAVMEVFPFVAVSLLTMLHWEAFAGLWGEGRPDWSLRRKLAPLPATGVVGLLVAITVLVVLPFAEEFWRCWRVRRHGDGRRLNAG